MLFSFFYEIILVITFLILLPKGIYQAIWQKKYRKSFFKRLGFGFPKIVRRENSPIVWVHAPSVGETIAIAKLVRQIKTEMPTATLVVSSTTENGHETAKKSCACADYHVYLPFDFYLSISHVLSRCAPDIFILSETDFWFRFLNEVKRRGGVTLLASGKISEKSFKSYSKFGSFSKSLFSLVDFFCLQDEQYKERFLQLGVPEAKTSVTGNIKSDIQPISLKEDELDSFRQKLCIDKNDLVVVVGSTHDQEEELILDEMRPLFSKYPNFKLIIAPRKPERFSYVKDVISKQNLAFTSWSQINSITKETRIILIDTIGLLNNCYQIANVAIVAGSFTDKVGGHNILEPSFFGVPVICGPYMQNQLSILKIAKENNVVLQVDGRELSSSVMDLLDNPEKRDALKNRAFEMTASIKGVTDKTFKAVYDLIPHFFDQRSCLK